MRVLHVTSGNLYGGIESMLVTLARTRGTRVESHFAVCFEGRLTTELRSVGAPVHVLGPARTSRPLSVLRARRRLRQALRQSPFDAVVCHAPWTQALFGSVAGRMGVATVFYAHGPADGRNWLERLAARSRPALAVANSAYTAATLHRLFPGVSYEVVHPPVAAPDQVAGAGRDQTRSALRVPAGAVVIVQVSRMEAWKGQEILIEACAALDRSHDWRCWIVGGAQRREELEFEQRLRETAARHGVADRVALLGQRQDVPALLAAADVYCQPNLGPEPFGIALVEALYAGLPVVTSALGGAMEIVTSSCGMTVEPGRVPALASALGSLVSDPASRARLAAGGPARARGVSDPHRQADRLADAIQRAVVRPASGAQGAKRHFTASAPAVGSTRPTEQAR